MLGLRICSLESAWCVVFHFTLGWIFFASTSPCEPTKPSGDAARKGYCSEINSSHFETETPLISEFFSMIPHSENCPSFLNEVVTVEFIPIISFIALVGLVVGFMKALLQFEAVMHGFLCLYQASQSA